MRARHSSEQEKFVMGGELLPKEKRISRYDKGSLDFLLELNLSVTINQQISNKIYRIFDIIYPDMNHLQKFSRSFRTISSHDSRTTPLINLNLARMQFTFNNVSLKTSKSRKKKYLLPQSASFDLYQTMK